MDISKYFRMGWWIIANVVGAAFGIVVLNTGFVVPENTIRSVWDVLLRIREINFFAFIDASITGAVLVKLFTKPEK